jgi:hypothetical protein
MKPEKVLKPKKSELFHDLKLFGILVTRDTAPLKQG